VVHLRQEAEVERLARAASPFLQLVFLVVAEHSLVERRNSSSASALCWQHLELPAESCPVESCQGVASARFGRLVLCQRAAAAVAVLQRQRLASGGFSGAWSHLPTALCSLLAAAAAAASAAAAAAEHLHRNLLQIAAQPALHSSQAARRALADGERHRAPMAAVVAEPNLVVV
jgi:hypothetical protein